MIIMFFENLFHQQNPFFAVEESCRELPNDMPIRFPQDEPILVFCSHQTEPPAGEFLVKDTANGRIIFKSKCGVDL